MKPLDKLKKLHKETEEIRAKLSGAGKKVKITAHVQDSYINGLLNGKEVYFYIVLDNQSLRMDLESFLDLKNTINKMEIK